MSRHSVLDTYEVRVEVEKSGSEKFHEISWLDNLSARRKPLYVRTGDKIVKMFHKEARNPEQACRKCEKLGHVIGARKVNIEKLNGDLSHLKLERAPILKNAIVMDEMIWKKRNVRIKNRDRDKFDKH